MKRNLYLFLLVFYTITISNLLQAQADYYGNISVTSPTFITDLHNLINPHTIISYDQFDETNVANFASRDTTGGQRVVTCVYSGENYVYTPPFKWGTYSREHTWCQSWMPSDAGGQYSDQHHLFPTQQNQVNGVRSNNPLGIVKNISSKYFQGKYGTDSLGNTVYEPRDAHKGDAARALFYMAVCYDGAGGRWFLPSFQNQDVLKKWNKQDPPDAWEIARNNYVYSLQKNRNPFVDHPEYADYINFHNLTYQNGQQTYAAEPTNSAGGFTTSTITDNSIAITWNDAVAGEQVPSGYLLVAKNASSLLKPSDGFTYQNDTDLSDGSAVINISYTEANNVSFAGLQPASTYYFAIYSFNGEGNQRNYKVDLTVPSLTVQTTGQTSGGSADDLFISEYVEGSSNNKYIEIFNGTGSPVDLSNYRLILFSNGATTPTYSIDLSGTLTNNSVAVYRNASATIYTGATVICNATNFNGDDAVGLYKISSSSYVDIFGVIGNDPGTAWLSGNGNTTLDKTLVRKASVTSGVKTNPSSTGIDAFTTLGTEWDMYDKDDVSHLGTHQLNPVPVELTSFTAKYDGKAVNLSWNTATEINNFGFTIERTSSDVNGWKEISFRPGNGTTTTPRSYFFTDYSVRQGVKYSYRLKQTDLDGTSRYYSTVNVEAGAVREYRLEQNYPNPFNPSTVISFSVPKAGMVKLQVYDTLGKLVSTLFEGTAEPGVHDVRFDASQLNSGIYFYRLEADGAVLSRKMILVK